MTSPAPASAETAVATVRVRCDGCGPRVIALAGVRLVGYGRRWEYLFACPGCGSRIRRTADDALRSVLRGAGAPELSLLDAHQA
ncbi:MAG: hypothetical protein ACRDVE_00840 [Actinocrinis sp.]